jgi:ubiquinone biosynthesis protein
LRAGSRHGVHNPGEFFLLTRTFVILESMIHQLDPDHDYLGSFREEIKRLTDKHFSLERIKEKTGKLARDMERLMTDTPGDTRRVLRRFAEGDLGRLQAPAIEALGGRVSRNLERLTGAIASAAFVIGGAMLVTAPLPGWYHILGEAMVYAGVFGTIIVWIGVVRQDRGRGRGRR